MSRRTNKILIVGLALLSVLPLRADNWLQNGDFTDGADHWRGDGKTPADMAPSDPFAKPDPLLSKGLIIPLKDREWTKITQNFRTKASELVFTVTFVFSPGLTFSDRDEDYVNIPKQIDNELYLSFDLAKNQIMALFTDFGDGAKGVYYKFDPKLGSSDSQTLRADVSQLSPLEDEVVTIAFPPGQGNVIVQNVSLEGH
jgi:hypothetical protein